jgi:hypothetical protein
MSDEMGLVERDIYEVANQLEGYVGPDTDPDLAAFLLKEGKAAAALADKITAQAAAIERLVAERDEAANLALKQFLREYHEAYGCDPVAMANGRSNWRKSAEAAEAQRDKLKQALADIDKAFQNSTRGRGNYERDPGMFMGEEDEP